MENYNTLANCNSTVEEACTVPSTTYNTTTLTALQDCHQLFSDFKSVSASELLVWGSVNVLIVNGQTFQTAGLLILTTVLLLVPAGLTPISVGETVGDKHLICSELQG